MSRTQEALESIRASQHARCVFCGNENPLGLNLRFQVREDRSVQASFQCGELFQGYPGIIHGGVVAAFLDAAMTNCLFSREITAVTAELRVRFLKPVNVDRLATITATVERSRGRLHHLAAELAQDRQVLARATAKFVERRPAGVERRR